MRLTADFDIPNSSEISRHDFPFPLKAATLSCLTLCDVVSATFSNEYSLTVPEATNFGIAASFSNSPMSTDCVS